MKKVLLFILSIVLTCSLKAQDHVVIYRNDGQINLFLKDEIDSISSSPIGLDGAIVHSKDHIVQEIHTRDSIYRIPLANIDSISSVVPESKLRNNVITYDNGITPFVTKLEQKSFVLLSITPKQYIPNVGDVVATTFDCEGFPDGLIARIEMVKVTDQGYVCTYSQASIDDLYEQIFYVGYVDNNEAASLDNNKRVSVSAKKILWSKGFDEKWSHSGTSTNIQGEDEAYIKVTITKTFTSPLSVTIDLVNEIRSSFDFQANSIASIMPPRFQIGPVIRCGRIFIPEFPLIWFEPQLSLYGYVKEEGSVDISFKAHFNRTDKITLAYSNHAWDCYYTPLTDAGVDVSEVSMNGYCEIGLQPEFLLSLNSSKTGIGISSSFGLRENVNFKFDALQYFNTGVYDAIKESKATLTSPQSVDVFVQSGLFEKEAPRASFNVFDRNPQIGSSKYILPSFTQLCQKDGFHDGNIIISTSIQKDLLIPVECGLAVYDSDDKIVETFDCPVPYKQEKDWTLNELAHEFTGLNPLKEYTCYPFVRCGGIVFRATPSKPIDFETKVITDEANNITSTKATLHGQIQGLPSDVSCSYGVCYKLLTDSDEHWSFVTTRQDHNKYSIEINGLEEKMEYQYCAFLKVEGEYTYGEIKKFKAIKKDSLNVDVVMCIDCTGSMGGIISTVRRNAISFYDSFVKACDQNDVELNSLTAQVIGFRDLSEGEAMQISSSYRLPHQRNSFNQFVLGLKASGGGDTPESGLEALSSAFSRLKWSGNDENYRQVVILWTDAPFLKSMSTASLYAQWASMPIGKRLILFAPSGRYGENSGSWSEFSSWPNTQRNSNLTSAFTDFNYILDVVAGELNGKVNKRMLQEEEVQTIFTPNK